MLISSGASEKMERSIGKPGIQREVSLIFLAKTKNPPSIATTVGYAATAE
jgi:hypothetical protein